MKKDSVPCQNFVTELFLILALLICNAARGLASRLARGLALTAAAVLNGFCNILGFNGLNSHDKAKRVRVDGEGDEIDVTLIDGRGEDIIIDE